MERPPSRPEGALIRLARKAAGLTVPDAARAAGISKARWSQVESGHEARNGVEREVNAKSATIAHMARAVGLSPERLETEGERPDAAEVLREILRTSPPPSLPPALPPREASVGFPEPLDDDAWVLWPDPDDPVHRSNRAIWRLREPEETRVAIIRELDRKRAEAKGEAGRGDEQAGLHSRPPVEELVPGGNNLLCW